MSLFSNIEAEDFSDLEPEEVDGDGASWGAAPDAPDAKVDSHVDLDPRVSMSLPHKTIVCSLKPT